MDEQVLQVSVEDYLEGEKESQVKHEYVHGEVWAMAGASAVHNTITINLSLALAGPAREKACQVYASDMKVKVDSRTFYYPDFMIVCTEASDEYFHDAPCVIVEVISKSTARTDQNEKRYAYQSLDNLELYLLVDSRKQAVTAYYKIKQGWQQRHFTEGDRVAVPCAGVELSFEDIYQQTPLAPSA